MNKEPFFIIIGRGRSGTTVLSKILNSHSSISIPGEFFFIINLFNKYSKKVINLQTINKYVDDVFSEQRFQNKDFSKVELKEYLLKKSPISFKDLCLNTYENLTLQQGKENIKLFGDKNPHFALFLPKILKIFDNVKFIFIVRDYRDNILSYKNVKFDMNNLYSLAYRWTYFNRKIIKYQKLFPDKFLLLKYEDLLTNSKFEMNRVCSFLNIEFESKMLDFYKNKSEDLSTWHINLNSKLNTDNINKWANVLESKQLQKIDFICNNVASFLGYKEKTKFDFKLYFKTIFYISYAKLYTLFELFIFHIPLSFRIKIINLIRSSQKTN
jgi:Sulfotransferase family